MEKIRKINFEEAKDLLIKHIQPVGTETVDLTDIKGRILAEDIIAKENVPCFDRSPYDGYAFKASDTAGTDENNGVTLSIIENIRAGQVPKKNIVTGTAIRLMTGAPLPEGADAICKYEDVEEIKSDKTNARQVTSIIIKQEYSYRENVIRAGEDIAEGTVLALKGGRVDTGLIGTMASLGITKALVYKRPVAGIISTGDEVVDIDEDLPQGKIRNSNRYTIAAALADAGIDSVYLGHASDTKEEMKELILKGENRSDIIISTGGVSAGDYDIVPDAMKEAGYELPVHGVAIKPGMACAYGVKPGRLMLALSGNPASSLTNLQCVCLPALKKLCGLSEYEHKIIKMMLKKDFNKGSRGTRFIRGRLGIEDGKAVFEAASGQGNVVISSVIGCNAYAVMYEGSGVLKSGDLITGFVIE
jgi:molybdopterin molybdotransferase